MPFAINAIFATLIVLGIMVLVHEFGHFITAKFFGVRVEIFSIGFGKRVIGFKRGDTDYRISLVPLGGYVKMSGETAGDGVPVTSADAARELPSGGEPDPGDFTNVNFVTALHGLLPYRLPEAQCHSWRDVGHILAEDEHGIREFNFAQ